MISFIVPVYYKKENYIFHRAKELISYFSSLKEDVELIISDSSPYPLLNSYNNKVQVIYEKNEDNLYSPAKSRNRCIKYCTKEFLFFLDVDLFFADSFISELISLVNSNLNNGKNFIMLPCLYMSKLGTTRFDNTLKKSEIIEDLRNGYMYGDNSFVERLAINTSAILISKKYFVDIGMFDEDFLGHGGEDFELLHRLAANNPHAKKNDDYYVDIVEQFPAHYRGFRYYLSYYAFPYLFTNLLLVHRWHPRALFNNFYLHRVNNESLLIKKMKEYDIKYQDSVWLSKIPIEDYATYLNTILIENNLNDKKVIGFEKSSTKLKRPFSAKVRKLITRPKAFFIDMFKKWTI